MLQKTVDPALLLYNLATAVLLTYAKRAPASIMITPVHATNSLTLIVSDIDGRGAVVTSFPADDVRNDAVGVMIELGKLFEAGTKS